MDRGEVYKFIRIISKKIYKFNYALMSDELQAEQLFVDAISAFSIKHAEEINQMNEVQMSASRIRHWLYIAIMRESFSMAQKRSQQLLVSGKRAVGFFKLIPIQKAVLYLKEVENLSNAEVMDICQITKTQVIENLYNARSILIEDFASSRKFQEGAVELS